MKLAAFFCSEREGERVIHCLQGLPGLLLPFGKLSLMAQFWKCGCSTLLYIHPLSCWLNSTVFLNNPVSCMIHSSFWQFSWRLLVSSICFAVEVPSLASAANIRTESYNWFTDSYFRLCSLVLISPYCVVQACWQLYILLLCFWLQCSIACYLHS
jgi:hypothetical protein